MSVSPAIEYQRRLRIHEAQIAACERQHARIASLRLGLAVAFVIAAWLAWGERLFSPGWLWLPVAGFVVLVLRHSRIRRGLKRARRSAAIYREGLARIEDRWEGQGASGERFDDPHHVYAGDLDLFGKASLFQLLSTARTRMGEDTLACWLSSPASLQAIQERHVAVAELRDKLELREDLAVLGEESTVGVHPDALLSWAEAPNRLTQRALPVVTALLAALAVASVVVWQVWDLLSPFFIVLAIEGGIAYSLRKDLHAAVLGVEQAFEDLELLSALLARLERERFQSATLQALLAKLCSHQRRSSETLARLRRIVQFIEARRNPLLHLLDVPLMYSVQLALAAERWRRAHGHAVRAWLEVTGEIEALLSLATYAYEHPEDVFPQFIDGPAAFDGAQLGHPLLPAAHCVRNDVRLGGVTRVLLVSGSNMSGKSTLLRTVGVNTVLAMAGAPVRARHLRLTPLQVGASIRVNDSLHEGSSRFYAEITRLRQIYDLSNRQPPLLFLMDELLQGTNSKDRRIGAEGVVRALIERAAIGLISTHDLALTHIEGLPEGSLRNVHFQDEIENGRMKFDFKLREGVVTKSNGLELMRSIGLEV